MAKDTGNISRDCKVCIKEDKEQNEDYLGN